MMLGMQITLEVLFQQLGLESSEAAIDQFVEKHQLTQGVMMHEADFWTEHQKQFLSSHWQKDDEWSLMVDVLNELLNQNLKEQAIHNVKNQS